jgi:polar amino acid transport system permease protein
MLVPTTAPERSSVPPQTHSRRSLLAALFALAMIGVAWTGLVAFKHSLSLSSFTLTDEPKTATFDVARCGATDRYRSGRVNDDGVARVTVPFGCWEARIEDGDVKGFIPRTATAPSTTADAVALVILSAFGVASVGLLYPAVRALAASSQARALAASRDVIGARIAGDQAREWAAYTFGIGSSIGIVGLLFGFFSLANGGVRTPFLNFSLMGNKFGLLLTAFKRNVLLFLATEIVVLVWGLIVAIARLARGKAGAPVRWLAITYIDLFRGIPALIVLLLISLGLRKSGVPFLSKIDNFWYAVISLSLTYGAYVAEVYRSGIDSIHWSQTAAARSLGLSEGRTLRFVVVPQALRRIIPPLLNDFIGLQKDTALVSAATGVLEIVNQAKIINSQNFNLSAMTVAAFFFYIITVPQARIVDVLLRRDQARMRAGG